MVHGETKGERLKRRQRRLRPVTTSTHFHQTKSQAHQTHTQRQKLLYVVNDPAFFISHRLHLAKQALQRGFQVAVAAPWGEGIDQIQEAGIEFIPLRLEKWGMNPFREFATLYSMYHLYRTWKPDIVHHVTIKPVLYGSIVATFLKIPVIVNAISGFGYVFLRKGLIGSLRRRFVEFVYHLILRNPRQRTIFQNHDDYKYFLNNIADAADRFEIILGAGIDLDKYHMDPPAINPKPTIMFVGRLLWDKGIGEFVESARSLQRKGVRAKFVAIGSPVAGNPASVSERQVERWIAEGPVEFWGYQKNIVECLKKADVVCLPSYREGLPRALLEAAASSRAIITTDVPGCREIVRDGFNGLLVEARSAASLEKAMSILIEDPELRADMCRKSRLFVEAGNYSEGAVSSQTIRLYEQATLSSL